MGDLPSGGLGTASFFVRVDGNATLQDYQLGCIVNCSEKKIVVALPLALTKAERLYLALDVADIIYVDYCCPYGFSLSEKAHPFA